MNVIEKVDCTCIRTITVSYLNNELIQKNSNINAQSQLGFNSFSISFVIVISTFVSRCNRTIRDTYLIDQLIEGSCKVNTLPHLDSKWFDFSDSIFMKIFIEFMLFFLIVGALVSEL